MSEALRQLIEVGGEAERKTAALAWKRAGGKVIGLASSMVPAEVVYAAGAMPWRLAGTWKAQTPLASMHRSIFSNPYNTHMLESLLQGEYDFLDGAVIADWDVDVRRVWDVWSEQSNVPPALLLYVPRQVDLAGFNLFADEIGKMAEFAGGITGRSVGPEQLFLAIELYDRIRGLFSQLYEMRKRDNPPLSGAEFLGLAIAGTILPPDQFVSVLANLLGELDQRTTSMGRAAPRVLVSSDFLDNPAFVQMIEDAGSLVAMDDLDTGIRQWQQLVGRDSNDPYRLLAKRYMEGCAGPRSASWRDQMNQLLGWIKDFKIDGVIELPLSFSHPRALRAPYMQKSMAEASVPYISLARDYQFSTGGQLSTRIEAFLEMLCKDI